jgi:hypothetical protein
MKRVRNVFFLISILSLTAISCSKYESGPIISLASRTNRLAQSWDYSAVYRNGLDITDGIDTSKHNYSESRIGFGDDNRFSYLNVIDGVTYVGDGFWEFTDNDQKLQLIYEDAAATKKVYRITRLEQNFFWFEEELDNSVTIKYELIPRN